MAAQSMVEVRSDQEVCGVCTFNHPTSKCADLTDQLISRCLTIPDVHIESANLIVNKFGATGMKLNIIFCPPKQNCSHCKMFTDPNVKFVLDNGDFCVPGVLTEEVLPRMVETD